MIIHLVDKIPNMKKFKLHTSFAVFLIFFGISVLEAFRTRDWIECAFWVGIGMMFLIAGNITKEKEDHEQ